VDPHDHTNQGGNRLLLSVFAGSFCPLPIPLTKSLLHGAASGNISGPLFWSQSTHDEAGGQQAIFWGVATNLSGIALTINDKILVRKTDFGHWMQAYGHTPDLDRLVDEVVAEIRR